MTDAAIDTKPNGASKAKVPERELTQLESTQALLTTGLKQSFAHIESLVRAIEAPARVATDLVASYKRLAKLQARENRRLRKEVRDARDLVEKAREDAWAREQIQLEFAHKIEMRGELLELLKTKGPEVFAAYKEAQTVKQIVQSFPTAQLEMLRAVLTAEQWAAIEKLRRGAPETPNNGEKENGNSQGQ